MSLIFEGRHELSRLTATNGVTPEVDVPVLNKALLWPVTSEISCSVHGLPNGAVENLKHCGKSSSFDSDSISFFQHREEISGFGDVRTGRRRLSKE